MIVPWSIAVGAMALMVTSDLAWAITARPDKRRALLIMLADVCVALMLGVMLHIWYAWSGRVETWMQMAGLGVAFAFAVTIFICYVDVSILPRLAKTIHWRLPAPPRTLAFWILVPMWVGIGVILAITWYYYYPKI